MDMRIPKNRSHSWSLPSRERERGSDTNKWYTVTVKPSLPSRERERGSQISRNLRSHPSRSPRGSVSVDQKYSGVLHVLYCRSPRGSVSVDQKWIGKDELRALSLPSRERERGSFLSDQSDQPLPSLPSRERERG